MTKQELLAAIEEVGIIPAVRVSSAADALFASETLFKGGISVVEITMTTPDARSIIGQLRRANPEAIVGAGTVLDLDTARACVDGGAHFLTSTGLDPELVRFSRESDTLMFPGALTPSEVMAARRAGAGFVKIYPCANVGGPAYIRALKGPFPEVRLIASGGVTQQTGIEYIRAGAEVLGIGHDLLPHGAISGRNASWIHELARRFLEIVKQGRAGRSKNGVDH